MPRANLYLLLVLIVLIGSIGFIGNAKHLIDIPGLLLASIIMMTTPALAVAFRRDSLGLSRLKSLTLVLIPIALLNFIYYITMGSPVGFQDVHTNINQYSHLFTDEGRISLPQAEALSFNFLNLFINIRFLVSSSGLDLPTIAAIAPPLFNLFIIIVTYVIVNRLHSSMVALISLLVLGWENQVLVFGQELRTQTIGTLLILSALSVIFLAMGKERDRILSRSTILIALLFGIVTASFVSFLYGLVLFTAVVVTPPILSSLRHWPRIKHPLPRRLVVLYGAFLFIYLAYISRGLQNVLLAIQDIYRKAVSRSETPSLNAGQYVYGDFVKGATYLFWAIFILLAVLYFVDNLRRKNTVRMTFFAGFGSLLVFGLIDNLVGSLSPGRIYSVAFVVIALVVSSGLLDLSTRPARPRPGIILKLFACAVLMLFVVSSVAKLPNYIVGETIPIRSEEDIDVVPYWDSELPQYSAAVFLIASNEKLSVEEAVLVKNYLLLEILKDCSLDIVCYY